MNNVSTYIIIITEKLRRKSYIFENGTYYNILCIWYTMNKLPLYPMYCNDEGKIWIGFISYNKSCSLLISEIVLRFKNYKKFINSRII